MSNKVIIDQEETLELIPQKHPMTMVDGLISHNDQSTISRLRLNANNLFCENGYLSEAGLIENIAQTAALRAGYTAKLKGSQPAIGFIGAVKNFKLYHLPKDNATLSTEVSIKAELMNALIVIGKIYTDQKLVAEAELSIFTQQ